MTLQEVWSLLNLYNSIFSGEQIDEAIGLILNGGIDAAVAAAQQSADAAAKSASDAAGSAAESGSAETNAQNAAAQAAESADQAKRYAEQAHAIAGENLVFSVNGVQADETGNVQIPTGGVKTINGEAPDGDGDITLDAGKVGAIAAAEKGAAGGVAELDASGKVPTKQLPAQTPEAIGAGRVNPNLLHNWYFGNPVNQRGQTEYGGTAQYTIDRWKATNATTVVFVADGYITLDASAGAAYFRQFFENALPNQTVTISAMVRGVGQLSHYLINASGTSGVKTIQRSNVEADEWELFSATYTADEFTAEIGGATFAVTAGGQIDILAVKLEYGTQQTLAHQESGVWVLNEIPDYGEQLALCQRYYVKIPKFAATGLLTSSAKTYYMPIYLPVPMRAAPVIVGTPRWRGTLTSGGFSAHTGAAYVNFTSMAVSQYSNNSNMFFVTDTLTEAKDTNNTTLFFELTDMEFSADL